MLSPLFRWVLLCAPEAISSRFLDIALAPL